jgi:hypothetical protein
MLALPSLGVRRPLSVNFSNFNFLLETAWPNEPKLGSKHLWKASIKIAHFFSIH